jgi:hypothetical protein
MTSARRQLNFVHVGSRWGNKTNELAHTAPFRKYVGDEDVHSFYRAIAMPKYLPGIFKCLSIHP